MSPSEKKEFKEAVNWLRNWYEERSHMSDSNGQPLISEQEKAAAFQKLEKAEVYFGLDTAGDIEQRLADGHYALTQEGLGKLDAKEGKESFFKSIMSFIRGRDELSLRGASSHTSLEPAIIYLDDRQNRKPVDMFMNDRSELVRAEPVMHWSLGGVTAHESTHTMGLSGQEKKTEAFYKDFADKDTSRYNAYLDDGKEIYARVNQYRFTHDIDPSHVFTKEEISALREKHLNQLMEYLGKFEEANDKAVKTGSAVLPDMPKGDMMLFFRYNDEQLLHFFNDTASLEKGKTLDLLHREGRADTVNDRNFACVSDENRRIIRDCQMKWERQETGLDLASGQKSCHRMA